MRRLAFIAALLASTAAVAVPNITLPPSATVTTRGASVTVFYAATGTPANGFVLSSAAGVTKVAANWTVTFTPQAIGDTILIDSAYSCTGIGGGGGNYIYWSFTTSTYDGGVLPYMMCRSYNPGQGQSTQLSSSFTASTTPIVLTMFYSVDVNTYNSSNIAWPTIRLVDIH